MNWPMVQLGQLAEIVGGSTPRREVPAYWGEGHYWATPTDLPMPGAGILELERTKETITDDGLNSSSAILLPVGTVLYSTRATIGKLAIARIPTATNQGFNNLIAGEQINNRYLAYALQYFTPEISQLAGTTTFKEVSRSALRGFKIPVAPPKEQSRIVELLDQTDALRRLRREADAKAARILPALFLKMFGDPASNPMGWPVKPLGHADVCEINPRCRRGLSDETIVSFVPMADVDEKLGRIVGKQVKPYVEVKKGFTPFEDGDVLFAKITPCMQNGKAAIVENLHGGIGFGSTEFHVLRVTHDVTAEYLYALVRLRGFRNQAMSAFTGSGGQQRVPADFLRQFLLPIPPRQEILKFSKILRMVMQMQVAAEQSSAKLENQFRVLLQSAFSGQLTAKWRQAHMRELLVEMQQQASALNLPMPQEVN